MGTAFWLAITGCFGLLLLVLHLAVKVWCSVEYRTPPDLKRPENCQRCGQKKPWLYYCGCVNEDEKVRHSLYVVQRAIERQAEKAPGWDREFGLKMVEMLRVMLREEIEAL